MWQRELSIPGTGNEDQVGTTLRYYSEKSQLEVVAWYDCNSNQLRLSMRSGEYVYQSESLGVLPLLGQPAMVQLLREALERFLALATLPFTKLENGWTPLELIILLYRQIDHLLAQ